MTAFDDLAAEQERLESILGGLDEIPWTSQSGAAGWTVADVVLHLAQPARFEAVADDEAQHFERGRGGGLVTQLCWASGQSRAGCRAWSAGQTRTGRRGPAR